MQTEMPLWDFLLDLWSLRLRPTSFAQGGGYFAVMPTAKEVSEPSEMVRLANVLAGLELARRALPDWIAAQIYFFDGKLRCSETGRIFDPEELDLENALTEDESHRWFSDFLKFARQPPAQRAQARVAERLRLIHVAVAIHEGELSDPRQLWR
ncbi:hypothetical protein ACO2Q1_16915 [Brevundimonas sp. VNH65]|uniref:hypothetical protein n=1 Tax=Brevundimonas sp. VNH65 TaxID=3400917 RepID=UPI003C035542